MQPSRMQPPATLLEKVQRVYTDMMFEKPSVDYAVFSRMMIRMCRAERLIDRLRSRDIVHRELQREELTQ